MGIKTTKTKINRYNEFCNPFPPIWNPFLRISKLIADLHNLFNCSRITIHSLYLQNAIKEGELCKSVVNLFNFFIVFKDYKNVNIKLEIL